MSKIKPQKLRPPNQIIRKGATNSLTKCSPRSVQTWMKLTTLGPPCCQILALPPFLPRSQLAGLDPTQVSLATLPTPFCITPECCISTADKRALTLVICKPPQTVEIFIPWCISGSKYSCLQALESLHGCREAPDAQLEQGISAALCWRAAGGKGVSKLPELCQSFTLESARGPSVFWAFLQRAAHEEILDPPGEEKKNKCPANHFQEEVQRPDKPSPNDALLPAAGDVRSSGAVRRWRLERRQKV